MKHPDDNIEEEAGVVTNRPGNYGFADGVGAGEVVSHGLTRQEFETKLRQLIRQAENGGMSGQEIIETLRQELEFTAECVDPHFRYTVQVINLGHDDSMGGPDAKAEDFREKWARNKFTKP